MFALPTFFICIFWPWSVKISNLWQPNGGLNTKPSRGCGVNEIPQALPRPKKSTKRTYSLEVFYIPLRNNLLSTPPPSAERFPTITTPLLYSTSSWLFGYAGLEENVQRPELWVLWLRNTSGAMPSSHLWILVGNNREFIGVVFFIWMHRQFLIHVHAYLSEHLTLICIFWFCRLLLLRLFV